MQIHLFIVPAVTAQPQRRRHNYRGVAPAERDARRREALLKAGFDLFGTEGWNGAPVTALCLRAGVTTRNFYELFSDREQLFLELYDQITAEGMRRIAEAAIKEPDPSKRLLSGLQGAVDYYDDPRNARIVFMEIFGRGQEFEQHRHNAIDRSVEMVEAALGGFIMAPERRERRLRLYAIALVGAFSEFLVARAARGEPSGEEIITTLAELFAPARGG